MKYIVLILIILSIGINAGENTKYIIKFKKYEKTLIDSYQKKYDIKKYFSLSNEKLLELKLTGEKLSGNKLNDLRTYFLANLTLKEYRNFKKDNNILLMYKDIKNIPRPVIAIDIEPLTPLWINKQEYNDYFDIAGGLSSYYSWLFDGGKGENVTIVDIEGGWTTDHEDLGIEDPNVYSENGINLTGTPYNDDGDNNHGTSVLGEIASVDNNYGVTGIAHKANIKVINDYSNEYGYSTADAIIRGISVLDEGSVILLESQKGGPNYHYDATNPSNQFGLVPDEWLQAEFDAIKTATSNGFIIIEAGANGTQNLDDEVYSTCKGDLNTYDDGSKGNETGTEPCFDINTRDSGAIIVGAANPPNGSWGTPRAKMYYTSYGKRVDVQAWGVDIYTTGYGDLFYPNHDDKQAYTTQFGGTSGASPMITGVVALLQSRYKEKNNGNLLTAKEIRAIIKDPDNSRAQNGDDLTEHIGPQPDIELIFRNYLNDNYSCEPKCNEWEYCNQDTASCILNENMCNQNEDCSTGFDCNMDSHVCVEPCSLIECNSWETCDPEKRICILNEGACNSSDDCDKDIQACDLDGNECYDPCDRVICQEHSTCLRTNNNLTAECVCDKSYLIDDNDICQYVEPSFKKNDDSCSYSANGSYFNLILIIFFLFLLGKKRYNIKKKS